MLLQWDRPMGMQAATVVPKPYLIAQHNWQSNPPRLFWYDVVALQEATMETTSISPSQNDSKIIQPPPPPLVTLVRDDGKDDNSHALSLSSTSPTTASSWQVIPPADQVGILP